MRLFQVDAFAERPFGGNPAAVCLVEGSVDSEWMQSVAAEMNLSETAFLVREGDGFYGLRWFTPVIEVELCGHATLASAHVLWDEKIESPEPLSFSTKSGVLTAVLADDGLIRAGGAKVQYAAGQKCGGIGAQTGQVATSGADLLGGPGVKVRRSGRWAAQSPGLDPPPGGVTRPGLRREEAVRR